MSATQLFLDGSSGWGSSMASLLVRWSFTRRERKTKAELQSLKDKVDRLER